MAEAPWAGVDNDRIAWPRDILCVCVVVDRESERVDIGVGLRSWRYDAAPPSVIEVLLNK